MSRISLRRLSPAVVLAAVALPLSLGGPARAADARADHPLARPNVARPPAQALISARTAARAAAASARLPGSAITAGAGLSWGQGYDGQLGNGGEPTSVTNPGAVSLPAGATLTQVSAGTASSEGLTSSGEVLAWGANGSGQLGDGNTNEADSPVAVQLPSGVTATQVAMGGSFGLALTSSGAVYAWGDNSAGELGDGSSSSSSDLPVQVSLPTGTTVTQIAAGGSFALALTSSGAVYAWGDNTFGELGDGTSGNQSGVPVQVSIPSGVAVSQLSAGTYFAVALSSSGVLAWGYGNGGALGNGQGTNSSTPVHVSFPSGSTITQVAGGGGTALALTAQGTVLAWGGGGDGQLGDGSTSNALTPVAVSLPATTTVTQVASGGTFGVAVTAAGGAYAWGDDSYGELGDGATGAGSDTPVAVSLPKGTVVQAVAAGEYHALAIELPAPAVTAVSPALGPYEGGTQVTISGAGLSSVTAVRFGSAPATSFTVNSDTSITATAPAGSNAQDITVADQAGTSAKSAADRFGYVTAGSAASFGDNGGELCNGLTSNSDLPVVAALAAGTKVKSVAPGIILTSTGKVYTCGDDSFGELGDGTTGGFSATPVAALIPKGVTVTAVASNGAGDDYAVASSGAVYAWGYGDDGELGDGASANSDVPVKVSLPSGTIVKTVAAEGQGAVAATSSGAVYDWGANGQGQLGTGSSATQSDTPVRVSLPAGVTATGVAGQFYGALVLASSGQVYAWGFGGYGDNGDGSESGTDTPVRVSLPTGTKATEIAGEADGGLALTAAGGVEAWGYGRDGELGDRATVNSDVPVAVSLPQGAKVTTLGSEYDGGLVTTATGQALAWGNSFGGSLGNGTTASSDVPVNVTLPAGVVATAAGRGIGYVGALVVSAPPAVSAVSPGLGETTGGESVTLTGDGFTGATEVSFGTKKAKSFTVNSPTSITVVSPPGTGTQYVRVTGRGGTSLETPGDTFSYVTGG